MAALAHKKERKLYSLAVTVKQK